MKLYICKERFSMELVDDNGFFPELRMEVGEGTIWERSEDPYRFVGADDTVRLIGRKAMQGNWIEITEEHLKEYFEPLA